MRPVVQHELWDYHQPQSSKRTVSQEPQVIAVYSMFDFLRCIYLIVSLLVNLSQLSILSTKVRSLLCFSCSTFWHAIFEYHRCFVIFCIHLSYRQKCVDPCVAFVVHAHFIDFESLIYTVDSNRAAGIRTQWAAFRTQIATNQTQIAALRIQNSAKLSVRFNAQLYIMVVSMDQMSIKTPNPK
jgi:hypothetical protein